ncbi:MAG: hypothetical protein F2667_05600 [Actinobacteria bacterium]|uniref:Unannotated protein n=1 Tax=freshwater metagenome TaxID=449393 RepID=A0A6J6Q2Y2_9ZZZZ|nr:hypothetical protein [Actinomycetota bacterium]
MRRPLTVLAVALLGAGLGATTVAAPASAGESIVAPTHGFDPDEWSIRGYDCAGAPAGTTRLDLRATPLAQDGLGALLVTGTDDSLGGVLRRHVGVALPSISTTAYAVEGDDPHGVWRVEIGEHTLISDPVPLLARAWGRYYLRGAVLHEGEWSGSIDEFQREYGISEPWTAGLLTGGCVGSPLTWIDRVYDKQSRFSNDLEPSTWVSLVLVDPSRLRARVHRAVLETGEVTTPRGARVRLRQVRTADGQVTRTAYRRTDGRGAVTFPVRDRGRATRQAVWDPAGPGALVRSPLLLTP